MTNVPIHCACGSVRGVVRKMTPSTTNRVVCYCKDCQAFAHYLGQDEDVLDARGGTQVLQISPGQVEFTEGAEHLKCLRLTDGGPFRWYAGCCKTPIGNTPASWRVSFLGLISRCLDASGIEPTLEAVTGPVRMHVYRNGATDPNALKGLPGPSAWKMMRFGLSVVGAMLSGKYRNTPFFDATGEPVMQPHRVEGEERAKLPPYAGT